MRADFRFALLSLFSVVAVLGVTPFALYRFGTGQVATGSVDLFIVSCICLVWVYAWRTGNTERAGLLVCITNSIGCVTVAMLSGLSGLLWMYPVLLANFLLIRRDRAVALSALDIIAVSLGSGAALGTPLHVAMFAMTAAVVSLLAYLFAYRTEVQRRQLEAIAIHDPLTGAYNRRGLEAELAIAMADAQRNGTPLGLAVFDLDHFKQVNDRFGHEAGDAVLVQLADLVRSLTRRGDRFFRLGGEEFALVLPGADAPALRAFAEHLREGVERDVACGSRPVTISIGATPLLAGESAGDWIARADAAMYVAKREGRNRVEVTDIDLGVPGGARTRA